MSLRRLTLTARIALPILLAVALLCAARGTAAVGPAHSGTQSVIGVDEREQILQTDIYPWRAIAFLELYDANDLFLGTCTGTFVGPDAVLTAGHCLYDAETQTWTEAIAVVPGKNGFLEPYGREFASDWWVSDDYIDSGGDFVFDWGIIKMPDSTLGNTVGWLSVANMTTETLSRSDFQPAIVGYPGDKPDGTMWANSKPAFTSVEEFRLNYDIDTAPGQSGSAIFSTNSTEPFEGYVAGIHTKGGETENSGSRIDRALLDDLLTGCQEMGCHLEHVTEPGGPIAKGDIDCDADVDSVDGLKELRNVALLPVDLPPECVFAGDVDCDDDADSVDGLKILRFVAAVPATLPPDCQLIGT